jgi:prevent-host-death family protein
MTYNMVMLMVNIFEIKAKLSEYLDRAASGERILICRHNKPVAELRPVPEARAEARPIGPLPGRPTFDITPAFFEPISDAELDQWEGVEATDPVSTEWPPKRAGRTPRVAESTTRYKPRRRAASKRRRS